MGIFFGHSPFLADIVLRRRRGTSFIINLTKYRHREHLLLVAEGVQCSVHQWNLFCQFIILDTWIVETQRENTFFHAKSKINRARDNLVGSNLENTIFGHKANSDAF